jgi:transcriptional regulator with XRE-family HTH domain
MEKLKTWRSGLGLSLDEAGQLIGVSGVQWHRYETGARRISSDKVPSIAKATGIPAEELRPDLAALFAPAPKKEKVA